MATSYTIEVGYNSTHDYDEVGEKLLNVVSQLQDNPERIHEEVMRFDSLDGEMVMEYCECYRKPVQDLTLRVSGEGREARVYQCASGGGEARDCKEACRRAFARLVVSEMHKEGMEVNFSVN